MKTISPIALARAIFVVMLALVLAVGCVFMSGPGKGVIVLEAAQLPATYHVQWSPNAASDNVLNYTLTVDGGSPITVGTTLDATCACLSQAITLTTAGSHSARIVANNLQLSTDPTSVQSGPPTTVPFVLNVVAGAPSAATIKK